MLLWFDLRLSSNVHHGFEDLMRYSGVQNINCPFISAGTHIVLTFINLTYSSNITADFFTGHKYITELTY